MQTSLQSDYSGLEELILFEECMPLYNNSIVNLIFKETQDSLTVLDFGAGIGTLSDLYEKKSSIKPLCIEIDSTNIEFLTNRGFKSYKHIDEVSKKLDSVFSSNVLEHIEDDVKTLKMIHRKMNHNSKIVLYLPAFMLLFSGLDEAVGHYRRYSKKEIQTKLKQAGFKILDSRYVDSIGFFASLFVRLVGYNPENGLGSKRSFKIYDRIIFPLSLFFDAIGFRFLFGKNIFVVAQKS